MENVIEINGNKYVQKIKGNDGVPMSHKMFSLEMMAMTMMGGFSAPRSRQTPKVDIVKEYGLIEQKKSNLSKRERDWVVQQFELNFTKLP